MYILRIQSTDSTLTSYFGPFKTERRAAEYATAYIVDLGEKVSVSIHPIIAPYNQGE